MTRLERICKGPKEPLYKYLTSRASVEMHKLLPESNAMKDFDFEGRRHTVVNKGDRVEIWAGAVNCWTGGRPLDAAVATPILKYLLEEVE